MYHDDYIMRQIEMLTRFLGTVLFQKQQDNGEVIDEDNLVSEDGFFRHTLFKLIDGGNINEAENLLHERVEEDPRREYLQIALDFYSKLNALTDGELEACDFSREEVLEGLDVVKRIYTDI